MSPEYVRPYVKAQKMGWLPPSPDGIAVCQGRGIQRHEKERTANEGYDDWGGSGKERFSASRRDNTGDLKFRKKLTRSRFRQFMASHAPAVVVMEACGSASCWTREMVKLGHEVKLVAPQYVRPFVKRQKNDAADAEAIVVAAQRPEMRFVQPRSEDQQACAVLFRARERLLHQRTKLVNALRSVLYEYGHIIQKGIAHIKRIESILEAPNSDLPELVREECRDLIEQIAEKTARIDVKTAKAKVLSLATDTAR